VRNTGLDGKSPNRTQRWGENGAPVGEGKDHRGKRSDKRRTCLKQSPRGGDMRNQGNRAKKKKKKSEGSLGKAGSSGEEGDPKVPRVVKKKRTTPWTS